MTTMPVHAAVVNFNAQPHKGFDAFGVNQDAAVYALCDGANSCPDSGIAARWLCEQMVADIQDIQQQVFATHHEMLEQFPHTASTLIRLQIAKQQLHMASLGDSFLRVYRKSWHGFGKWSCVHEMPRDLNAYGHPSQLLGSEMCEKLHMTTLPMSGIYCMTMMSDGPGLLLPSAYVAQRLSVLGKTQPSAQDLNYLCVSLAEDAQKRGCQDDTSVALIWLQCT
jgi:serine/threonine protein phosphatase PrpC